MTFGDGFILSVMALSVLFAWLRGLSRELVTLLAIGVSIGAVYALGGAVSGLFGSGAVKVMLSITLLFLVAFAVASVVLEIVAASLLGREPHRFDKIAGAVFGLLRGWLIVGLAYVALTYYFPEDDMPEAVENARFAGVAKSAASALESFGLQREYGTAESNDTSSEAGE